MRKLLIADMSEDAISLLADAFRKEYEIAICRSGDALPDALRTFCPDVMILDLAMPVIDGFEALRRSQDFLPPIILATTVSASSNIVYNAMELGVGHMVLRPFSIRVVKEQLAKMVWLAERGDRRAVTPLEITLRHLETLGIFPGRDGFQMLRTGIPMLAQDPGMPLTKELYPEIRKRTDSSSWRNVEHNIRFEISYAWQRRDPELWKSYFPQCIDHAPTNSEFLRKLALMVEKEIDQQIRTRALSPTK